MMTFMMKRSHVLALGAGGILAAALTIGGCFSPEPEGTITAAPAATTVRYDFFAKPLPEIPLPNDLATRYDATSATGRRLNASQITPTQFNSTVRKLVDQLDGWGVFQTISIPFTGPLDIQSILDGHRDVDYDTSNDVVYLIDIDPDSPHFGTIHPLDIGEGNYPHVLEKPQYWKNDHRGETLSLLFDEVDEDKNGNGKFDLGGDKNGNGIIEEGEESEDSDADGVFDRGNYLPGTNPKTLAERADSLMTFYESETNTLLVRPMEPLHERTTYAVVVTRRLKDADLQPVGSPFPFANHASQTEALKPLADVLPDGLAMSDVAFAFTFTTQSIASGWVALRDGLYGKGLQSHLGEEFPATLDSLFELRGDPDFYPGVENPYIMYSEQFLIGYKAIVTTLQGGDPNAEETKRLIESHEYIDYSVIGTYTSPQLFERESSEKPGVWQGLNLQRWPEDLDRTKVRTRPEKVHFWLFMPRRETSERGKAGQVPVVLVGHGYGSARFDIQIMAGFFAKHGIATIAIDNVSHGISIEREVEEQAKLILGAFGLGQMVEAILTDRAYDQNNDGRKDSGADFWSTYLFHTRDVVRQSALDYMQLIRIIRSFDGQRTWDLDVNRDGVPDLAGDFDGDGLVDIGADSIMGMVGGSLGGMMSVYLGSLEPELASIAPIAAGGGLGDLGVRSQQGGVREAFILRALCPLIVGTPQDNGKTLIEQIVPDLNDTAEIPLAEVEGIAPGDTIVAVNLENGAKGCSNVNLEGNWRLSIETDLHDRIALEVYAGPQLIGDPDCAVAEGATPKAVIDTIGATYEFQGSTFEAGEPLVAMAEGFGIQRGTPDLRRLFGLGQLIVDPADPAAVARHLQREPLHYPGTDQTTGTHMFIVTTAGDMGVPVSGGMAIGRAAGLIEWRKSDDRYGKPPNQVLLDTYTAEAAHNIGRYFDNAGNPVHIDVENFSMNNDPWKDDGIERLDPPLHLWGQDGICDDAGCGYSGAVFPFPQPEGQHGFRFPGGFVDVARKKCLAGCDKEVTGEAPDPCGCKDIEVFDMGTYMLNLAGRFMGTGGKVLDTDLCLSRDDCDYIPPAPPARPADELLK